MKILHQRWAVWIESTYDIFIEVVTKTDHTNKGNPCIVILGPQTGHQIHVYLPINFVSFYIDVLIGPKNIFIKNITLPLPHEK